MQRTITITKRGGIIDNKQANIERFERILSALQNGTYVLTIERRKSTRTLEQNALMWLWFACIADETGSTPQDAYDHYCNKFLSASFVFRGNVEKRVQRTSLLTKEQMSDFLNRVQADAASELQITLPSPEDYYFLEFQEMYKSSFGNELYRSNK